MNIEIVGPIVYIKFEIHNIKSDVENVENIKKYRWQIMNEKRVRIDTEHRDNAM